jgi:hypothetical protein
MNNKTLEIITLAIMKKKSLDLNLSMLIKMLFFEEFGIG